MNINKLFIHSLVDLVIACCDCSALGPTLGSIVSMKAALCLSELKNNL